MSVAPLFEAPALSPQLVAFARITQPTQRWDEVIAAPHIKERIIQLTTNESLRRSRAEAWRLDSSRGRVLLFSGSQGVGKTALAHGLATRLERDVMRVRTHTLAATDDCRSVLFSLLSDAERLGALVLIEDCEQLLAPSSWVLNVLEAFEDSHFEGHRALVVLTTSQPDDLAPATARLINYRARLAMPDALMREQLWEVHLPPTVPLASDIDIPQLAAWTLTGADIRAAVDLAVTLLGPDQERIDMATLQRAAREQLAHRACDPVSAAPEAIGLHRLILPAEQREQLETIISACRHHSDVMARWGFGRQITTGRGVCILLDGPAGTGKTFCTEIFGSELQRPVTRVHLPSLVGDHGADTERNVARTFERAARNKSILVFDEADALFARRTGAVDRRSSLELDHLLQEIERHDGISIIVVNHYGNLDEAALRRARFRVSFSFPEWEERARIWLASMPPEAPVSDDVRWDELGMRFELAGADIQSAILRAAYLAMAQHRDIDMGLLVDAGTAECARQGKLVRSWD